MQSLLHFLSTKVTHGMCCASNHIKSTNFQEFFIELWKFALGRHLPWGCDAEGSLCNLQGHFMTLFLSCKCSAWKFQKFNFCVLICWHTAEFCLFTPGIWRSFLSRSTSQLRESKLGLSPCKKCWCTLHISNQPASHYFEGSPDARSHLP